LRQVITGYYGLPTTSLTVVDVQATWSNDAVIWKNIEMGDDVAAGWFTILNWSKTIKNRG